MSKPWQRKFPDVSRMSAEQLLELMFSSVKASKETPDDNTFDVTVNVAVLRLALALVREDKGHDAA